ncbi:retrovirus-related pol polyprotein from transposon TNT 1-94 [Tanacetum coccineum]
MDITEVTLERYTINSKAFRVFNSSTRIVEENLHVQNSKAKMETILGKDYILLPLWLADPLLSQSPKSSPNDGFKPLGDDEKKVTEELGKEGGDSSKEDENDDEDVGTEADMNNLDAFMPVSPIPTTRIHIDHPVKQIIRDLNSAPQTRRMTKNLEEHGTKWVYRNKKDERGIVIKNKARLIAQGYTQEEGMNYDEKFLMSSNGGELHILPRTASKAEGIIGMFIAKTGRWTEDLKFFGLSDVKIANITLMEFLAFCSKMQWILSLWYPKDSPFDLVAYTDSDYAGASLDRKSTTGGCQFLGCRLISWQCKKQTVVANSTTEAECVAASSCCAKDSNEKKLIQMIKIHADKNVVDLLTKAFDNGIGVNVGDSKLMLLGINLLLLGKVNAARHKLTAAWES